MSNEMILSRVEGWVGGNLCFAPDKEELYSSNASHQLLVVDDDPLVRVVTARMLRQEGFRIVEADSARTALRKLEQHPAIEFALIDLVMPDVSGFTLAQKIAELAPACRIILMTGYTQEQSSITGQLPILFKPFTTDQLLERLNEARGGSPH